MSLRLAKLLFEEVVVSDEMLSKAFKVAISRGNLNHNQTSEAITDAFNGGGFNLLEIVKRFLDQAKPHILQAIGTETVKFEFLGVGAVALAFSVTNTDDDEFVLKIESGDVGGYSSISAQKKMSKAIKAQNTGAATGKSQPRVYDGGSFEVQPFGETRKTEAPLRLNWFLIQKLETNVRLYDFQDILEPVFEFMEEVVETFTVMPEEKAFKLLGVTPNDVVRKGAAKALADVIRKIIPNKDYFQVSSKLRLAPDWIESLMRDALDYAKDEIRSDFHIGNVGIERKGAEGYLKFFD